VATKGGLRTTPTTAAYGTYGYHNRYRRGWGPLLVEGKESYDSMVRSVDGVMRILRMFGMIVDCHTHVWQSPDQLGQLVLGDFFRGGRLKPVRPAGDRLTKAAIPPGDAEYHWSQAASVDKSIVLGFKSRYMGAEIPNRYV